MRNRFTGLSVVLAATLAVASCGTAEHTNTLLFGTNTKLALDLSVNPAGGTPDVTLGYKRQEAVWMPLLANQKEASGKKVPAACGTAGACLFKSGDGSDAYSVMASFGVEFSTNSSGEAAGGLAQFFSTGLAAQKLAEAGGARLVSVNPNYKTDETIVEEKSRAITRARESGIEQITAYFNGGTVETSKREALMECAGLDKTEYDQFDGQPVRNLTDALEAGLDRTAIPQIGRCAKSLGS